MARTLPDISFDEQDANLFRIEDARLRADALKHSVLPRLQVVMNEAIASIREKFGIEALADSIISIYPNFRTKRTSELKHFYDSVFVGLGGQRSNKWPGFTRQDGKPVQVLPFRFAFTLDESGVFVMLENGWLNGLTRECFERILRFHLDNETKINSLCFASGMRPAPLVTDSLPFISTLPDQYRLRIKHGRFDNFFFGHDYHFPVLEPQLRALISAYTTFFPIYDSYIQMAKGFTPRLDELIDKLNVWFRAEIDSEDDDIEATAGVDSAINHVAAVSAEQRIRVMPAIRWQVFQRDGWKCVACGRTSHHGAILHIDHILPRSRGGHNGIDNYQTLCDTCNLGKSNRDATDLRGEGRLSSSTI